MRISRITLSVSSCLLLLLISISSTLASANTIRLTDKTVASNPASTVSPSVTTENATNIAINSATVSGNLTALGTANPVNVFFEYGTTTSYGSKTAALSMNVTGEFSADLTGLSPGTTYHFRAKADGGVHGTATGADMTFVTWSLYPPEVRTSPATDVTTNTVALNGNLWYVGTTVNVFFEYGTTTSYGRNTAAQSMNVTGEFRANLTGLSPGTTYHFRAKADGGVHGTATGADRTFTTTVIPPAVITFPASDIAISSATVSGNLTALGTANPVNVFFEYGTSTIYGSNTAAQSMTGTGAFSTNLIGLRPGTTYHFRAKADGGMHGTATGADRTFTTTVIPPAVITFPASDITISSAAVSGNLTALGAANPVNVFFEYGTTTNYGSNTAAQSMTGTGAFSANLIGLSPGTTYHFRAKADGGVHGTATGADMTFTTTVIPPAVITVPASDIAISSTTVRGNLTALGTAYPVNVFFEYGTSTSYGSNTAAQSMNVTGEFRANLTGLSPGTTYHFRAKADGGVHGTAIGADMTFTTLTPPAGGGGVGGGGLTATPPPPTTTKPVPTSTPIPTVTPVTNWGLVIGIIAGVVVIGLVVFFVIRQKRRTSILFVEKQAEKGKEPASLKLGDPALYAGKLVIFIPPSRGRLVTILTNYLQGISELKIISTGGSNEGTTILVALDKPLRLMSILSETPGVEVTPEPLGEANGVRRIKLNLKERD